MKKNGSKKEERDRIFLIRPLVDEPGFFGDYLDMVFSSRKEANDFISKCSHPLAEDKEFKVVEFIEID
jgi:hypothetical protein